MSLKKVSCEYRIFVYSRFDWMLWNMLVSRSNTETVQMRATFPFIGDQLPKRWRFRYFVCFHFVEYDLYFSFIFRCQYIWLNFFFFFFFEGKSLLGSVGEMVFATPFPHLPLGLWGDHDRSLFKKHYCEKYPGIEIRFKNSWFF